MSHPPIPEGMSPEDINVVPELRFILGRLRESLKENPNASGNGPSGTTPAPASGTTPGGGGGGGASSSSKGALTVKEFPAACDNVRHKIQRARRLIQTAPDMQRTIAQQEAEIAMLEERKRKQIATLMYIKEEGMKFAARGESTEELQLHAGGESEMMNTDD
ncbi:RNA polymerase II transcription mediator complex subunit 9-domain-containing protein [Diplogelasinospora grovesii]|uniref:Mediator of RNA polymerase II transcription subunit 9 n=1 Tax=Diplogelasinospora grovesii TaxID=303347 RepID=A0AAN6S5M2_9PEZI|nr:RNA polymerase II transcription mediator complex subunit 9-domain-containing protein [Diplogelasinospora grovesii]